MNSSVLWFSVCIPVYNGRKWLAETLASLRGQIHPHWELIVIEDASTEPSNDIVETFAASVQNKVTYHINPTNIGCARSRDLAHGMAAHDYIAPLDCDDIWKPEHLATMAKVMAAENADFVFTGCTTFHDDPASPGPDFIPAPELRADLRAGYFFCQYWTQPSSIAFHRRLFDRIGRWSLGLEQKPASLPGNRDLSEDRNFILRAFKAGVRPQWTGCITTFYRQHDSSMRGRDSYHLVQRAWLHNELGLFDGFSRLAQRRYLGHVNVNAARVLLQEPRYVPLAAKAYFQAWRWWPWRLDRLVRAALTFLHS